MLEVLLPLLSLIPIAAILYSVYVFLRRRLSPSFSKITVLLITLLPLFVSIYGRWQGVPSRMASLPPSTLDVNVEALTTVVEIPYRLRCIEAFSGSRVCTRVPANGVEQSIRKLKDCSDLGVLGECVDKASIVAALKTASYAFNRIDRMALNEPDTFALVIDTSGSSDFDQELEGLRGSPSTGTTPISMQMEAELVGPSFKIEPEGRQRREISTLNPTRWEWEVTPKREGEHPLEVSLYVILTKEGEKISEDKPLAERQIINVTVSRLDGLIAFAQKLDPLRAFIFALVAGLVGLLAWFGIKSWKDVFGKKPEEEKPQKIEVTIKDGSDSSKDGKTEE